LSLVTLVSSSGPQISGDAGGLTDDHGPGRFADLRVRDSPDNRIFAPGTAPVLSPLFVTETPGGLRVKISPSLPNLAERGASQAPFQPLPTRSERLPCLGMLYLACLPMPDERALKPLHWIGSSLEDLRGFPRAVQRSIGVALRTAQFGRKHESAKPLKGFKGAGVLEVVEDHDANTYRAVYTVRFADSVYVLHVFQKKSKKGIQTPKHVVELIRARLRRAERDHREREKRA
jgi:phage-related protein